METTEVVDLNRPSDAFSLNWVPGVNFIPHRCSFTLVGKASFQARRSKYTGIYPPPDSIVACHIRPNCDI